MSARRIHSSSVSQIRTFNANRTKLLYDTNDTDGEGCPVTIYENDIVLTVTDAAGAKQTVTEGYTVALYNGADNALTVDQTRLTKQRNRLLISYGGQWTFLDIKVKKNDILSKLTGKGTAEEPYTVATAAHRLLKSVGYEAELTSWGGASQAPVLFYVLIGAAAVLVVVLILLLCGMKKKKQ